MQNKKVKAAAMRKKAEELKAKKKQVRLSKEGSRAPQSTTAKGRSAIGQSKKKKR